MDKVLSKVLALSLLGGISLLLGTIPLKLGQWFNAEDGKRKHETMFSSMLCFGGGLLISTSILHMLPEVRGFIEMSQILSENNKHVPLAEIMIMIGFFIIYFIEELVDYYWIRKANNSSKNSLENMETKSGCLDATKPPKTYESNESIPFRVYQENGDYQVKQEQGVTHTFVETDRANNIAKIFTVLALSFHALLEGMAVGLETDSTDIWIMFIAIGTHKFVIIFCVGLELYNAGTPGKEYMMYMLMYSFMSPVGIGIGTVIDIGVEHQHGSSYHATVGILQALAGGTLLYLAVFEILQREKCKENLNGIVQFFFVLLGFLFLMAVELSAPHNHECGNNGNSNT